MGNKRLISVQANQIKKLVNQMGRSLFLCRLYDLEVRPEFEFNDGIEKVRVLPPRLLHLHSGTDAVLNVTFVRAPSSALLKVVPLVFRGEDVSPGLKKGVKSFALVDSTPGSKVVKCSYSFEIFAFY